MRPVQQPKGSFFNYLSSQTYWRPLDAEYCLASLMSMVGSRFYRIRFQKYQRVSPNQAELSGMLAKASNLSLAILIFRWQSAGSQRFSPMDHSFSLRNTHLYSLVIFWVEVRVCGNSVMQQSRLITCLISQFLKKQWADDITINNQYYEQSTPLPFMHSINYLHPTITITSRQMNTFIQPIQTKITLFIIQTDVFSSGIQKKLINVFVSWSAIRKLRFVLIFKYCQSWIMEGKRTIESAGGQITEHSKLGGNFVKTAKPQFIQQRVKFFINIKERLDKILSEVEKPDITVTVIVLQDQLKDGKQIKGQAFVTTPYAVAKSISKNLAEAAIVARVKYTKRYDSPFGKGPVSAEAEDQASHDNQEYELVDLTRPLQGDCLLELLTFQDKIGKEVFWHSSSHLLGQSLQNIYGAWLCHGPPLENGFFYDSFIGEHRLSQTDYESIEKEIKRYASQKQPYERILITKQQALQLFAYNPFKVQLIKSKVPQDGLTSAYRCGNLIDLCTGPHLPSADRVKGFKVTKNSSAYWLGKKENDDLQRVYAISYPKQSQLDEYLKQQQQLAQRDHRNIGPKQQLFNFTTLAPGCALFFPHGAVIYNRLIQLMRSQYKIRGYSEVISPNVYNSQLWKTSGHYFKYKENIFFVHQDTGEEHGLKPMNCPGHCVMFDMVQHSYRDLPIRMADFGVLHRNQLHGALSGLTRVRRFQQDDAHIFCTADQIEAEILGVLDLMEYIYSLFGFKYNLEFSTRPEKYLGSLDDWNTAEAQLKAALIKFGKPFKLNEGDGAFYGPKIDVKLFDVFGRQHQCGTCQLDFQLPVRFNLQYRAKEVKEQKQEKEGDEVKSESTNKQKKKQKVELTEEQIQKLKKEKEERKKLKEESKLQKVEEHPHQDKECKHKQGKEEAKQPVVQEKKVETLQEMEQRYSKIGHLKTGFTRPVIVHRAIFGSLERFIAILCEHTGGKWDFWISPRQIQLIPMGNDAVEFTEQVYNTLLLRGYSVSIDRSGDTFNKKIRNAQNDGYNYIGVIGKEQVKEKAVNLRKRDEAKQMGKVSIADLIKLFEEQRPFKSKRREQLEAKSVQI